MFMLQYDCLPLSEAKVRWEKACVIRFPHFYGNYRILVYSLNTNGRQGGAIIFAQMFNSVNLRTVQSNLL